MTSLFFIFCHVYLLTSFLQPVSALDITIQFIHQFIQQVISSKVKLAEREINNNTLHKWMNDIHIVIQITISLTLLIARTFVLLSIILIMASIETYVTYRGVFNALPIKVKMIAPNTPQIKTTTTTTTTTNKTGTLTPVPIAEMVTLVQAASNIHDTNENNSTSTTKEIEQKTDHHSIISLPASPQLLPTPPSEKEEQQGNDDSSILMNNNHLVDKEENVVQPATTTKETIDAPSQPTPPDNDDFFSEQPLKQQQKQQIIIMTENSNELQDKQISSPLPNIENTTVLSSKSVLAELPLQPLADCESNTSSTTTTDDKNIITNNDNIHNSTSDSIVLVPSPCSAISSSHDDDDFRIQQQQGSVQGTEQKEFDHVVELTAINSSSNMPTDSPNQIQDTIVMDDTDETNHTNANIMNTEEEKNHTILNTTDTEEEKNHHHHHLGPSNTAAISSSSPSISMSSSLSTLNPSSDKVNMTDQNKRRSYNQLHQKTEKESHTDMNPLSGPAPVSSSLSMKLNKLKQPGRKLSQLFKKKNKK
ncbi:uncharacterized protein BX664DRAFT_358163 [Halteromyces radiatus]|uniref:uncharacterized protein n=1 Tax=Halteromyces radiatus TaxID=101107 RepID=UPI00221FA26F|nr:uncharacterized protein BX664DRAFT_358163 [Halteromyces radiatus]KAI8093766.1 hypothetical protein BX664DRAFT_358163 [Halteromyces radiatus]